MSDAAREQLLAVGRVARAHGVRGRILLVPYNSSSDSLTRVTALWLAAGSTPPDRYEVTRAERTSQGYLIALRGVEDRDAAAALRGREAFVDRSALPAPDAGEIYAADLIGFCVVDALGTERGRVIELETAGPQELLRVRGPQREWLVPFALVQEIDEVARRILVDAPEGLFDLEE
jgi:16S rRNA processing protein RimM